MSIDTMASGWTVTLQHPVDTKDASAGVTRTYANDASWASFPAGIQPLSAKEKWANSQRLIFVTDKVYTAFDIGAKRGDRLTVAETGQIFIVEGYRNAAGQNRLWVTEAREQT